MSLATNTKLTDNTQWGVFLLSLLCIALGLSAVMSDARAESSSCVRKAATQYPWICTDADAGKAFAMVDAALAETLGKIEPRDREIFKLQQESWEQRMSAICEGPLLGAQTRSQCIASFTDARLQEIGQWPRLGQTIVLDASPINERACDAVLQRNQIAWRWKLRDKDNYALVSTGLQDTPAWKQINFAAGLSINKAQFDFVGDRSSEDVFDIRISGPSISYNWYIATTPDETASIEQRLRSIHGFDEDSFEELVTSLQYPIGKWRNAAWNQSMYERKGKPEPALKSSLYDSSNTELYKGWYTTSRVAIFEDQTFLLVSSVNNLSPSVALFRPNEGGVLKPICFHDEITSAQKPTIRILSDHFRCPIDLPRQQIGWEKDAYDNRRAALDLPEWSGRRWVAQRSWASHQYSSQWLDVSAVGAMQPPDENAWEPVGGLASDNGDTIELILTEAGPYIASTSWIPAGEDDDRPVKTTYYRIHDNRLTAVCERTITLVPPPGYAVEGGTK